MRRYAVQRENVQPAKAARSTKDAEIFSSDPMPHTSETVTTTGFLKIKKRLCRARVHVKQPARQIRSLALLPAYCRGFGNWWCLIVGKKLSSRLLTEWCVRLAIGQCWRYNTPKRR